MEKNKNNSQANPDVIPNGAIDGKTQSPKHLTNATSDKPAANLAAGESDSGTPQPPIVISPAQSRPTIEPEHTRKSRKPIIVVVVVIALIAAVIATIFLIHDHLENQRLDAESVVLKENLTIEFGQSAKVSDFLANLNGSIIEDKPIDTEQLGQQEITFEYINVKNRKRPSKFTIEVVDTTKPKIFGGNTYTVYTNHQGELTDLMMSGDNVDDNPVREIHGSYDINKPGTYELKYSITDASGNQTVKPFTLNVINPPTSSNPPSPQPELTPISSIIKQHKTTETKVGIDVSQWQGEIDWEKVKASGVEFAMLRIGYQYGFDGEYVIDPYFEANLIGAKANQLPVGLYSYSYATTPAEARAEAEWIFATLSEIASRNPELRSSSSSSNINLELGIAFDWENWSYFNTVGMSFYTINKTAETFLKTVEDAGYKPLLYSSKNYLDLIWQPSQLAQKIPTMNTWLAQYYHYATYDGDYQIWQMTDSGRVLGINEPVDIDIMYLKPGNPADT